MISSKHIAIVDFQGFLIKSENEFVLKELSFTFLDDNLENYNKKHCYHHYIFSKPYDWVELLANCQLKVLWTLAFYHGFYWNQGQIPYENIDQHIQPLLKDNLIIYVKGKEKTSQLKDICKNQYLDIKNIEEIGFDSLLSAEAYNLSHAYHCNKHRIVKHCALQNVIIIENWLQEYFIKTRDEYESE